MKIYHYVIIFAIFMIMLLLSVDIVTSGQSALTTEQQTIEANIDKAILEGTKKMAETIGADGYDKENVINTYFTSLYASFGVMNAPSTQELLQICTPVILLTEKDGFSVFYHEITKNAQGNEVRVTRYSPKQFYSYDDGELVYSFYQSSSNEKYKCRILDKNGAISNGNRSSVYEVDVLDLDESEIYSELLAKFPGSILFDADAFEVRRIETVSDTIERELGYYCNHHNTIAQDCGFTYVFSVPEVESGELKTLSDAGMIVVFQGYPYNTGKGFFNRVCFSAANVIQKEKYYCDTARKCYHRVGCPLITPNMETVDTRYEAAQKGLFRCDTCGE